MAQEIVWARVGDHAGVELYATGEFCYLLNGRKIQFAFSRADSVDGRRVDSISAKMGETVVTRAQTELGEAEVITTTFTAEGLVLEREIQLFEGKDYIVVRAWLKNEDGTPVSTRYMQPMYTPWPRVEGEWLFNSLDQKMIQVPYDNDGWARYESVPVRPGRRSYDLTVLYNEDTFNGLVLGAVDFKVWKNAITVSGVYARAVMCECGVADDATHDAAPHGIVTGEKVGSARFIMHWCDDIRLGLENFGDVCAAIHPPIKWEGHVPFGFNTFAGFGGDVDFPSWQAAGDLIHEELKNFGDEDGVTYINLDATFGLDEAGTCEMVKAFHARGQKCGTYHAPYVGMPGRGLDMPLEGDSGLKFRDILLKDETGRILPAPDHLAPLDVTHPAWESHVRAHLKKVIDMGFDYLKIDFMSHAAMEGKHYNPAITTGRQALTFAYEVINDELSKAPRPIFLSLSIAPLFPHGYGHARRQCCDSFGHHDDVRYVLNAVNFAWWANRRLYHFNDPDHVVLYKALVDNRPSTLEEEARSRFNTAVISGTVMLLSDNYGPHGDEAAIRLTHERAARYADNPRLNAIAREGVSFRPIELRDATTPVYTCCNNGKQRAAFFNFSGEPATVSMAASRAGWPQAGRVTDLNRDITWDYQDTLSVALAPYASAILEWE